jgi:hypothetical protein
MGIHIRLVYVTCPWVTSYVDFNWFYNSQGGKKGYRAIKNGQGDRGSPQSLVTDHAN